MRKVLLVLIIMVGFLFIFVHVPRADELDDITKQLASLKDDLKNKEANHDKLLKQITDIKARVGYLEGAIKKKEQQVADGEKTLAHQKDLLDERAQSYYKNISKSEYTFITLLAAPNLSDTLQNFFYQKTVVNQDKNAIIQIVLFIKDLEQRKQELEDEKVRLAKLKGEVDAQSKTLAGDIASTQQKVAQLSAQQQSLIASKLASLNIPRSAGTSARGCSDDRGVDPGFSPALAFFTFGAPHRVGMNQYGAKGRAATQGREDILKAYYNFDAIQDANTDTQIKVDGSGTYDLEKYMRGIHEMPPNWPAPALEAQAIAARSYVMAVTNNGANSICSSESCQVFSNPEGRSDGWTQAVEATRGKVMVQGGGPIKAWFASTHGGYEFSSAEVFGGATSYTKHMTDTTTGSAGSFADLQSNAYDRGSPWFYCDWGSRGDKGTAWLKPEEVADIVNVTSLARKDPSKKCLLYQPDKPPPPPDPSKGCSTTDNWSPEKVRQELGGEAVTNVTEVSLDVDFGSGRVRSVNAGGRQFDASEFKNWFNLRAPANIQIVGPLFNVEKR